MFTAEIKKLILNCELVSIERNCADFELTGIIRNHTDEVTSMLLYNNDGQYDGFTVFETDQITEVFWGNREHKAIAKLVDNEKIDPIPKLNSMDFQDLIVELNDLYNSICFYNYSSEESFDIAEIEKYDDDWFKIHSFGNKKSLSRTHKLIDRHFLSRVLVDSQYQNNIVDLHKFDL